MLALMWLANSAQLKIAEHQMHKAHQRNWRALQPLRVIAISTDEGDDLTRILVDSTELSRRARRWVLYRLGDLPHPPAVPAIVRLLAGTRDYTTASQAAEALTKIGGAQVEAELQKLLTHDHHNGVRRHAVDAIFKIQAERALPLARRMLAEENFGRKGPAFLLIGRHGTAADLAVVLPFCDYWSGDRANHYWATDAMSQLRSRHGYEVNGPIAKHQHGEGK